MAALHTPGRLLLQNNNGPDVEPGSVRKGLLSEVVGEAQALDTGTDGPRRRKRCEFILAAYCVVSNNFIHGMNIQDWRRQCNYPMQSKSCMP